MDYNRVVYDIHCAFFSIFRHVKALMDQKDTLMALIIMCKGTSELEIRIDVISPAAIKLNLGKIHHQVVNVAEMQFETIWLQKSDNVVWYCRNQYDDFHKVYSLAILDGEGEDFYPNSPSFLSCKIIVPHAVDDVEKIKDASNIFLENILKQRKNMEFLFQFTNATGDTQKISYKNPDEGCVAQKVNKKPRFDVHDKKYNDELLVVGFGLILSTDESFVEDEIFQGLTEYEKLTKFKQLVCPDKE